MWLSLSKRDKRANKSQFSLGIGVLAHQAFTPEDKHDYNYNRLGLQGFYMVLPLSSAFKTAVEFHTQGPAKKKHRRCMAICLLKRSVTHMSDTEQVFHFPHFLNTSDPPANGPHGT